MKNIFYLVFAVLVSCGGDSESTFNISGQIKNLNSDLLYSKIVDNKPFTIDTIKVKDAKFSYKANRLTEDDFRFLIPMSNQKKFIKFFADNSDLQISGNADSIYDVVVSGSKNNDIFVELMKDYESIDTQSQLLALEMQMAKNDEDGVSVTDIEEELYANEDKKPKLFIDFAKNNPNRSVSPWALLQIVQFAEFNDVKPVYESLSDAVKQTTFSKDLKIILDELGKTAIGVEAPSFTLPSLENKNISLSDFRGMYVLIDFWSPMCTYCRLENPHLVDIYSKYRNNDFEIVGVNVEGDINLDIWELVIEEDNMQWTQLRDTVGVADIYKVKNTPSNILIDTNGVIIAKDLHQEDLDKKLEELFGGK